MTGIEVPHHEVGASTAGGRRHARRRFQTPPGNPDAPLAVTRQYLPALDGLRAVAVAGVVCYHLGLGWASGGYLGVDLFFVLSGFLITSLLLEEWALNAGIRLLDFWSRRARRLLPALFLMLFGVAVFVVANGQLGGPGAGARIDLSGLRGDALATLFYIANWHAIFAHQSYFAQFSAPSPLQHTWSLAIEEQFYLIWPPILLMILYLARTAWRNVGLAVAVVGSLISASAMALLYHGGDPTRVYFGTDTRMFDLLVGIGVAMLVAARPQPSQKAQRLLHYAGPMAAIVLGFFWVSAGTLGGLPKSWMFRGGFLFCALLAAVVIADVRQTHLGMFGRVLAVRPVRWVGRISYGIYLWHWPIIVYLSEQRTGLSGAGLDLARIGLTLLMASASFYLVERPIRQHRFGGFRRWTLIPACAAAMAGVIVVATIPAIAAPVHPAPAVAVASAGPVPGAGGFEGQTPIALGDASVSPAHPLRIMLIGDSVLFVAARGIAAAFAATGEAVVHNAAIPGFGLSTATNWRTSLPQLIAQNKPQLIVASWSWDDSCTATSALCALQHPRRYKLEIEDAVRLMLTPGNGVKGIVFVQFPPTGPIQGASKQVDREETAQRAAGQRAWNNIVRSLPSAFPRRVMYFPLASSVLLHGQFSSWLPPLAQPSAPKRDWVRVRMIDRVHLCPAGVVRYGDALLADLTDLYHLTPAAPGWWDLHWTTGARFNDPPGSCPNDHPPS